MLAAAGILLVVAAARMSLAVVPRAAGKQLELVEAAGMSLVVVRLEAAGTSVVAAGM